MRELSNLGKWVREKYGTQVVFAEKMGVLQGRVSKWILGAEGISQDYQAKIRKLGYAGPWPQEEAREAAAPAAGGYVTREEYGALDARLKAAERSLEETRAALVGATGAIRMLALKAGSPEIEALLK